ncbi:hypothetical protein [Agromyces sp. NPDC056965]|uniref:hypothetical protein n=1 Tax=Agromyces sp. NPDC056965 TaxID=3345983 RepID=UPI003626EEC6
MYATSDTVASFSVLRLAASALDDIDPAVPVADGVDGYLALLAAPSGAVAARGIRIADASAPYDFIVVEHVGAGGPYTRAWVRHHDVDGAVSYSFFTETPAPFPLRSYPLDALQPREGAALTAAR